MISHFFIDRPILSTVISVVIVILGVVALFLLPIAQYPEVAPPTIQVSTVYPGANARVVADTVATPIEQEINGVERMLYMSSRCTNDGQMLLDITFALGTDLNMAQVLVQNRVAIANARLPEEVKRQGVTTKKRSPNILLVVHVISPDATLDQLYLSNYGTIRIRDELARITGVGDVSILGARDYSIRVWLDPERLASHNMTASDVNQALREQNVQVAAGKLGQPPVAPGVEFQLAINTQGRLLEPDQFENIIIKTGSQGEITRLRDIGRVELGAKNYDVNSYLDGKPAISLAVFQLPGSNALSTANEVRAKMVQLKRQFPAGMDYRIVYDTTMFIDESVHEVYKTLFEAFVLVFIVVLVFLQDWRATILPMIDVPVSLIGTLAVMKLLGFSLNNLTLFGLVLAIGIVVDDAIVVLENVERWMAQGLRAREATRKAMEEILGPVIAITLVLCSVFIPTAFMAGIAGQFYRQFALTIAASTVISAVNAMTMTPSRAVQIFAAEAHSTESHVQKEALPPWGIAGIVGALGAWLLSDYIHWGIEYVRHPGEPLATEHASWSLWWTVFGIGTVIGFLLRAPLRLALHAFLHAFNRVFEALANGYAALVRFALPLSALVLVIYAGLMFLTWYGFATVPTGFIPEQDKGYLVVNVQLPDGASLERTEAVMRRVTELVGSTPGVAHTMAIPGYSVLTGVNLSNMGGMFVILEPFEERRKHPERYGRRVQQQLFGKLQTILEAQVLVFGAPPVEGIGNAGGFKLQVQDLADQGPQVLQETVDHLAEVGMQQPGIAALFTSFRASQPQVYLDIDRSKAKAEKVALNDIFDTLQTYLGSAYANDYTRFGRNWQVNVQADSSFRLHPEDIGQLKTRNAEGAMVPLATLVSVRDATGPAVVNHYNMYPSAEINGATLPGMSSGQAMQLMDEISQRELSLNSKTEWTELSLQERLASEDLLTKFVFPLGVVFVFLVLAAQYESWILPLAIIMIVPMCLLAAIGGIAAMGMDNNLFTQIGLVVLVGLAAKNAILIVEFAHQNEAQGMKRVDAIVEACRLRLRPILMTSFAFILGVLPLVRATGAGAEMRTALGVAVFSGMLGVTIFGLLFTPVFYYVITWIADKITPPALNAPVVVAELVAPNETSAS